MVKRNFLSSIIILFLALTLFTPNFTLAHPGRTDSSGCHTCRTNCSNWGLSSGEYHCHRAKATPQPKSPIKSTFGENGTGFTQPAPEYQNPSISNTETSPKPKSANNEPIKSQSKKGFWQWLSNLFN